MCQICRKAYVHSGNYVRHVKHKHSVEALEMLETQSPSGGAGSGFHNRSDMNIDKDEPGIDDLPPVGKPILIDKIEYHEDRSQPMNDDTDMKVGHTQTGYPNP